MDEDTDKARKNSCCILRRYIDEKVYCAQGVLLYFVSNYFLVTNHHVIPSVKEAINWTLCMYDERCEEYTIKLCDENIDYLFSCCGLNGILGKQEHGAKACWFELDFTLIRLKGIQIHAADLIDLRLSLSVSDKALVKNAEVSDECFLYQRNLKLKICKSESRLFSWMKLPNHLNVIHLTDWGDSVCKFEFRQMEIGDLGSSGCPIYMVHNGKSFLIGIHTRSDPENTDEDVPSEYDITVLKNTNFLWILQLYLLYLCVRQDIDLNDEFPVHLLWAIFLRYENKARATKSEEVDVLLKVADAILDKLQGSNDEEIKMYNKIKKFFNSRPHRYVRPSEKKTDEYYQPDEDINDIGYESSHIKSDDEQPDDDIGYESSKGDEQPSDDIDGYESSKGDDIDGYESKGDDFAIKKEETINYL